MHLCYRLKHPRLHLLCSQDFQKSSNSSEIFCTCICGVNFKNCVTSFSSYHSHKPGCPRRPPAQHADTNPPSVIRFCSTLPKLNEIITLTSVLARQCFIFGKCKISRLKWFLKFFKDNNLRQIKKKQGAKHCNKVSLKTAWFNKQILQPVEVLQMDQNTKLPHLKSKTVLSEWLIKTKISKSI